MRLVVQRVLEASVVVDNTIVSHIKQGFLIYVGIHQEDTAEMVIKMADKVMKLRVFEDDLGKMNQSIDHVDGTFLIVSQFTLYGDTKKGNRPSFTEAASFEKGLSLYELFCNHIKGFYPVKEGVYGAHMLIHSINDGPVTLLMEETTK